MKRIMRLQTIWILLGLMLLIISGCTGGTGTTTSQNPSSYPGAEDEPVVRVVRINPRAAFPVYDLYVNGIPHDIKGASLQGQNRMTFYQMTYDYVTKDLPAAGVNSIRTYGSSYIWAPDTPDGQAADAQACFNMARQAQASTGKLFTVIIGLNMGNNSPSGTGNQPGGNGSVNYKNPAQVKAQYDLICQTVDKIIALNQSQQIAWCIGNEIVGSGVPGSPISDADKIVIYKAIDNIAAYIKSKSTLLTMTACPALSTGEINLIAANTSHIDCLGTNAYFGKYGTTHVLNGFLNAAAANFAASKWTKSWIVSEYGSYTLGWADVSVSLSGFPGLTLQSNSTQNAQSYLDSYRLVAAADNHSGCLGGYVLAWQPPVYSNLNLYFDHMYAYKGAGGPFMEDRQNTPDRLECVELIRQAYQGPGNFGAFPKILDPPDQDPQGLDCNFKATLTSQPWVTVGTRQEATVKAQDLAGASMAVQWYLEGTPGAYTKDLNSYNIACTMLQNGDAHGTTITTSQAGNIITSKVSFLAPAAGNFRLRAIVRNTQQAAGPTGNSATAAVMFQTH